MSSSVRPFIHNPGARLVFGPDTLDRLGSLIKELGGRRVLLVTDPGVVRAGLAPRACRSMQRESLQYFVFDGVVENPTTREVEAGLRFAERQDGIDFIVGFGGGSAMDCAKGINFLLTQGGRMEDYRGAGRATLPMLPSIGVPTTAGTGSEAQSFALIAQEGTHRKMACGDEKARFRAVILDPLLARSAPLRVIAAAGIDAIAHALESYVTTKRNPVSAMFSGEAWRLLEPGFESVLNRPGDVASWSRMLLGAHWAGAAIENSMLGAAHACANPLTAAYGLPHGVAVGLMLPHVVCFNSAAGEELYRDLHGSAESLVERIVELRRAAGLPQRLRDCRVVPSDLPRLAREASSQWTGKFNPRPLQQADWLQLYESSY